MAANLERLAQEYQQRGHPEMADYLNNGAKIARNLGVPESFSVAETAATVEPSTVVKTPEAPVEIKRFSKEQREALEKQGFVIYGLTGQSIKTLRDEGRQFGFTWHKDLPDFEALGSMHSEVAFNPNKPFLPKSNNKTLAQQEEMVIQFSEEVAKKVPGVKAIIGQAPDYVELAFAHFDATKEYLFGAKDNYDYARTKTPTSSSRVAGVGRFDAGDGLAVPVWSADYGDAYVRAAPLVVPVYIPTPNGAKNLFVQ